jgi:hypothetical protein
MQARRPPVLVVCSGERHAGDRVVVAAPAFDDDLGFPQFVPPPGELLVTGATIADIAHLSDIAF